MYTVPLKYITLQSVLGRGREELQRVQAVKHDLNINLQKVRTLVRYKICQCHSYYRSLIQTFQLRNFKALNLRPFALIGSFRCLENIKKL